MTEPINLTAISKVLSGSNQLIPRTFLFMTFYAQTTPWGILLHPKSATSGIILQNMVIENSKRSFLTI